jgi:hypothetical protein
VIEFILVKVTRIGIPSAHCIGEHRMDEIGSVNSAGGMTRGADFVASL